MKFRCARKRRRREDRPILDGITDLRYEGGILDTLSRPQWTNDKKRETWGILFLAPSVYIARCPLYAELRESSGEDSVYGATCRASKMENPGGRISVVREWDRHTDQPDPLVCTRLYKYSIVYLERRPGEDEAGCEPSGDFDRITKRDSRRVYLTKWKTIATSHRENSAKTLDTIISRALLFFPNWHLLSPLFHSLASYEGEKDHFRTNNNFYLFLEIDSGLVSINFNQPCSKFDHQIICSFR